MNGVNVVTIGRDGWHDVRQTLTAPVQVVVIRPHIGHSHGGGGDDNEDNCLNYSGER